METKKEEAILKAYNNILQNISTKYKKQVTSNIDENGWCIMFDEDDNLLSPSFISLGFKRDFVEKTIDTKSIGNECKWRPKSLQGIENNNGWHRVDDGMPDKAGEYLVIRAHSNDVLKAYFDMGFTNYDGYRVTHWQPIVKPKPPIY